MKKTISGIRGIFGDDLTLNDVSQFCNNFCSIIKSKKCVIGTDTRPSGKAIKKATTDMMIKNGVDVFDLGISPTPVVFREARKYGSGIVITSSHNPIQWNGLKFIIEGRGINEDYLNSVLSDQQIPQTNVGQVKEIQSDYVDMALRFIDTVKSAPKVVIDIGGGAARDIAPSLLRRLGCQAAVINKDLENSSRGPDPTSDQLAELTEASKNADIGFAFDLDGDRVVVVKDGKKQAPDVTLGLGVAKALELGYKRFVLSIDTSVAVEKLIKDGGGTVERSKVGEANVVERMIKTNAHGGGEGSSAGFIIPEFNYCRDGILTSGFISSMFGSYKFSDTLNFMEGYKQVREKIEVDSNFHDVTIQELQKKMMSQFSEIITIDGVKGIVDENSWVLVRKSNTEDIIRVSAESNNPAKSDEIVKKTLDLVRTCYETVRRKQNN